MASRSITNDRPDEAPAEPRTTDEGFAPSILAQDEPTFARIVGMIGAALLIFGGTILLLQLAGWRSALGLSWVVLALATGIAALLFHAAYDSDRQFRRMYLTFGSVVLLTGIGLLLFNWLQQYMLAAERQRDYFTPSCGCLILALLFILAALRHEDVTDTRRFVSRTLLLTGVVTAILGIALSLYRVEWLTPYGTVLPLIGLAYLVAFVAHRGTSDETAYRVGCGVGIAGVVLALFAVGLSIYPSLANQYWPGPVAVPDFFIPRGILFLLFGLSYSAASYLIVSDSALVVLIRRELGAFFYSPIIYIVLIAFTIAHWLAYIMYVVQLLPNPLTGQMVPTFEPIVAGFILQWTAIFCNLFVVPAITMRLLSEEHRSGTLEVLLTAPVTESGVVLSKFIAGLLLYLLTWVPFALLMIGLRVLSGIDFDYRPLLSFGVILVATGSSFIAMGLLFSSLTRDQVASGVLSFAGMLTLTLIFLIERLIFRDSLQATTNPWGILLRHMSYIDLWIGSLEGKIVLRYLMFPVSITIFCLFLTVKVLEARKWK